ncbi:MAG: hypothetical protein ACN6PN_03735 [Sphingobacterium sp.]
MKKNIFTIILVFLATMQVFGQKNADFPSVEKFYNSVIENLKYYPDALQDSCIGTITLIKIHFDDNGELQSIDFSDSAQPVFVKYIQEIRNRLNFKSIYQDLKQKGHVDNKVLIPFQIDTEKMDECKSTISSTDLMKLYVFDGKPCAGEYFLYPYIYVRIVAGKEHEEHF